MPDRYWLSSGAHATADHGRCAMEFVAYLAGEPHTDRPACVSPMLREFYVRLNDALPDDQRQRLRPYLARAIGTAGDGLDMQRRWMCVDWLIRVYLPAWLDLVPDFDADTLRARPVIATIEDVSRAAGYLRQCAAAVADAAWTWPRTRGVIVRAAIGSAISAAARAAEAAAAWVAVCADQPGVGVFVSFRAARAAEDVVRTARVCAAAGDVARPAAWAAVQAARSYSARAGDLADSVVVQLQDGILIPGGLLDRMLPTEAIQMPAVGLRFILEMEKAGAWDGCRVENR